MPPVSRQNAIGIFDKVTLHLFFDNFRDLNEVIFNKQSDPRSLDMENHARAFIPNS